MSSVADQRERRWLADLGRTVWKQVQTHSAAGMLKISKPSGMKPWETNTEGWYVPIGKIPGDRGSELQIWLDRYTREETRRLSLSYKTRNHRRVEKLGMSGTGDFGTPTIWTDAVYERVKPGTWKLARPLPPRLYERPIVELYEKRTWCFYTVYIANAPRFSSHAPESLIQRITDFFLKVASALEGLTSRLGNEDGFSDEISRAKIVKHLRRERSPILASRAKHRDGYICRICEFSFVRFYGGLGRGFAEAHHIESVSTLRKGARVTLSGLLTVCANCHRMVHRLGGGAEAVKTLRRIVAKQKEANRKVKGRVKPV